MPVPKWKIVEQRLHDRLAIVERALHREIEDVIIQDRRHLPLLDLADAAVRMQDEDADAGLAADAMNRGAAGIPAGRPDDVQRLRALVQKAFEEVAEQLQCNVLEGQRGTMVQLKYMHVPNPHDRRHIR